MINRERGFCGSIKNNIHYINQYKTYTTLFHKAFLTPAPSARLNLSLICVSMIFCTSLIDGIISHLLLSYVVRLFSIVMMLAPWGQGLRIVHLNNPTALGISFFTQQTLSAHTMKSNVHIAWCQQLQDRWFMRFLLRPVSPSEILGDPWGKGLS